MPSAEEILARTSGRTTTVEVCPDGELLSEWERANADYLNAKRHQGGTLGDDSETAKLGAQVDRLLDEIAEQMVVLSLREVRPGRVAELKADHALSKKEAEKRGLRPGMLSETFWAALATEAIIDPEFTEEQVEAFLNAGHHIQEPLMKALDQLHGGGADPKAAVDTARRRSGASS